MDNQAIAQILREIGIYLEMDDVPFRPRIYEKASDAIEALEESAFFIYERDGVKGLENIPSIGISIAEKIEELIKTGHMKYYNKLRKKVPVDLEKLLVVDGLGPKKIKILYKKLKIKNVSDLEKAARSRKISKLEGFKERSEKNILKGIEFLKESTGRFVLGNIMPQIREIEARLKKIKGVDNVMVAGSARRRKETIGDIDILVITKNPKQVMDYFISMPEVIHIYSQGNTKSSAKLKTGIDIDLRVVSKKSYGAALNYFTGSKNHNIALREIAIKKGWILNEYGLFKKTTKYKVQIAGKTEEEIYNKLDLNYIEPELREMVGEMDLARSGKLPILIDYNDLKGDLQVQSNWTDGVDSIEELAEAAIKEGLEYIAITDHTKRLAMTHGLDERRIKKQWLEIDKVNQKPKIKKSQFRILKGTECDILKDGSMDLPDNILAKCDLVGASVHSFFNLSRRDQTERIKRAMSNPNVDIIFHPTGRVINKRPAYQVDIDDLINHAKKTKTIMEIDAYPDRLDLKDEYIRKCINLGVKMSIDSDAHSIKHFKVLEYGIAQARRGFATKKDVINAWPLRKMLEMLK